MTKHPSDGDARRSLILVVADDADVRDPVDVGLRAEGYEVCTAPSASEAFGRVLDGEDGHARCVDLVLADLRRDRASGLELVVALRGIAAKASVLLMTSLLSSDQRDVARVFGVDVLDVPFAPRTLARSVEAILQRRPQAPARRPGALRFHEALQWPAEETPHVGRAARDVESWS